MASHASDGDCSAHAVTQKIDTFLENSETHGKKRRAKAAQPSKTKQQDQLDVYLEDVREADAKTADYVVKTDHMSQTLQTFYDRTIQDIENMRAEINTKVDTEINKLKDQVSEEQVELKNKRGASEMLSKSLHRLEAYVTDAKGIDVTCLPDVTSLSLTLPSSIDAPMYSDVSDEILDALERFICYNRTELHPVESRSKRKAGKRKKAHSISDPCTTTTRKKSRSGDGTGGDLTTKPGPSTSQHTSSTDSNQCESSMLQTASSAVRIESCAAIYPQPDALTLTPAWRHTLGADVCDIVQSDTSWWISTSFHNIMLTCDAERRGEELRQLKKPSGSNNLCIDTKRDQIVNLKFNKGIVCTSNRLKAGRVLRRLDVPGCKQVMSVMYCSHRDVYVIADVLLSCLWFVSAETGEVVTQLGSSGAGNSQFDRPMHVASHVISDAMCHIIVSDYGNDCVKVFDHHGTFLRRYGSTGSDVGQLKHPGNVCGDLLGGVIVCDTGNKRLVRYHGDLASSNYSCKVLLDQDQLKGDIVLTVSVSPDGRHLVAGICGSIRGLITAFTINPPLSK